MGRARITILDGAVGTRLGELGVDLTRPGWSAGAIEQAPELLERVHREYVEAGAQVVGANTFRTTPRRYPDDWPRLTDAAVRIARRAAGGRARVAGCIAPLEDCYRPDLSPAEPRPELRQIAQVMAESGVDIILCETFPHVGEALVAAEEAVATGVETWVSFTAGPSCDLLTPGEVEEGAKRAAEAGAAAVLVNCIPATRTLEYVRALAGAGVPFGAYANAGSTDDGIGWNAGEPGAARYAEFAALWIEAGATLVGGCCGTGPEHIRAVSGLGGG